MEYSLITIIESAPKIVDMICYDIETMDHYNLVLLPELMKFHELAVEYCTKRDSSLYATKLTDAKTKAEAELKELFVGVAIQLMSSYGANMHLDNNQSDIDFGVLIENFDKNNIPEYKTKLEKLGYVYNCEIHNYFSFQKDFSGVEVEVKVRDLMSSIWVVKLHNHLDSLPQNIQQLLAYAKSIVCDNSILYRKLKQIIYSAYHTEIIEKNKLDRI